MLIICDALRWPPGEDAAEVDGPLFCSFEVLKHLYRMMARNNERSGLQVVFLLMVLAPEADGPAEARSVPAALTQLRAMLAGGLLRKSDTVAHYGPGKLLAMLSVDRVQGAQLVARRISERCTPAMTGTGVALEVTVIESAGMA